MRNALIAVVCLLVGALGALGYSHYLGEGKQLADLQDQLAQAKANLAKASTDAKQAKSESDALSAQVQQLTTTKDDLKKQLETAQASAPAASGAPAAPVNPLLAMGASMMKNVVKQQSESKLMLWKKRLNLTPDQEATVKAAMDEESKRTEEMTSKMLAGGKIDPTAMAAEMKNNPLKPADQVLQGLLTPEQKVAYKQMQTEQRTSSAESMASSEVNEMSPLLQLNESQKDQVYSALAQSQLQSQDPEWIKTHKSTSTNPVDRIDEQEKTKEDALAKILTPDQMATYHQQQEGKLQMQKDMMKRFMPQMTGTTAAGSATGAAPANASSGPAAPASDVPAASGTTAP